MAEVKHTPWEVVSANDHHGFYVVDVAGRTVCDLYFIDRSDVDGGVRQFDGADTYARLIAAAPDLFDFAQALDSSWSESFPDGPDGECRHGLGALADEHRALWKQCRAALSKATAQQEGR